MDTNLCGALACLALATLVLLSHKTKSSQYQYPPGPRGWPLIGNVLDMPTTDGWVKYIKWSREYKSDIIHLNACGTHVVVLNSVKAISDLLDKRSTIYSSRPSSVMMNMMGWSWSMLFLPDNAAFRAQRRHFRQEFDGGAVRRHCYPSITGCVHNLLKCYLEQPEHWKEDLRHMIGAIIMDVTFGIQILPTEDPYVRMTEAALEGVEEAAVPGRFLVDTIPALRHVPAWMPGAGWKRKVMDWRKHTDAVFNAPFRVTKAAMANGTAKPCFCVRTLQNAEASGELDSEEYHIQAASGNMYAAGYDTTIALLETFMLAMLLYPEVQKTAQEEMDRVLGFGRLPTFSDKDSLPYLCAVLTECLRWAVIVPLAIPHVLTEDDEYKGYFLPKGSILLANSFYVLHDEKIYSEPYEFKPERFLKDGEIDPSVRNPTMVASFGYGRRVCPGRSLAEQVTWLVTACILAMFNISKVVDSDGNIIEPSGRYVTGLVRRPDEFECQIKPRSSEVRDLIKESMAFVQ